MRKLCGEVAPGFGIKKMRKILARRVGSQGSKVAFQAEEAAWADVVLDCVQGGISYVVWLEQVAHGKMVGEAVILMSPFVSPVIRASSFPILSRPREFSDLPTWAVSVFKHNRDGTIFSTKDHIGITPSDFSFFFCYCNESPYVKILKWPLGWESLSWGAIVLKGLCHIPQMCCGRTEVKNMILTVNSPRARTM